jgi:hypothetical protein
MSVAARALAAALPAGVRECPLDDPLGERVAASRAGWRACIVNGKVLLICPQCADRERAR